MISLEQFFDPSLTNFEEAAIIGILIWQERRLRKVEEYLNRLLGEDRARREVKR